MAPLAAAAFAEKPDIPLPIWAQQNVFLDRRMTTRPGYPDPEEYPGTWAPAEILRTRHVWEKRMEDGAVCIVDPGTEDATVMRVHQMDAMKSTQTALTETALHAVRYCAKHDPQNIIFGIDNRVQAGMVNEIRLLPTLRKLGADVLPPNEEEIGKFAIKMRRMVVYLVGSYSAGEKAQKMCELGINDELEEHGNDSSVDDMLSRMKTSPRRLLFNISRPKKLMRNSEGRIIGGPITLEHSKGSQHVREVPCPHCTDLAGGRLSGYQELKQENKKFSHCKNMLEEWDFERVLNETYFECIHCHKPIEESHKRWMQARDPQSPYQGRFRFRWRRTNPAAEPNHISFHFHDFLGYDDSVRWGRLAIKYIKSKGDPVKRDAYRNDHEGLPVEVRESKTEVADLLLLRGPYKRGTIPWKPRSIILTADVGLTYVKWGVSAFRRSLEWGDGEMAVIDWGKDLHPDDVPRRMQLLRYPCLETGEKYGISLGKMDAKYRRIEVHKACLKLPRKLFPSVGIRAGLSLRSVSANKVKNRPGWFFILVYNDDDAKSELYIDRIGAWAHWLKIGQPADEKPMTARIWFPEDVNSSEPINGYSGKDFLAEHTREHLGEMPNGHKQWKPRTGDNEGGDISKVACVTWRFYMLGEKPLSEEGNQDATAEIEAAISTGE